MKATVILGLVGTMLIGGSVIAQDQRGSQTPSSNRAQPKFQDGTGPTGESNTKAQPGTKQNSASQPSAPPNSTPSARSGATRETGKDTVKRNQSNSGN